MGCKDIFLNKAFPMTLMILDIAGAFGCGTYTLFLFMTHGYKNIRTFVALLYLLAFSVLIPSAELGLMRHPQLSRFARFVLSPIGRAFLYIFMGGVILGNGVGGWVVGIYLFATGIIGIFATCTLRNQDS